MGTVFLAVVLMLMDGVQVEVTVGAKTEWMCTEMVKGMLATPPEPVAPGMETPRLALQRPCQPYLVTTGRGPKV